MMAPAGFEHGKIGSELLLRLRQHANTRGLAEVVGADTGFLISRDPDTVRSLGVAFVSQDRVNSIGVPKEYWPGAPDLAVEVISPNDTLNDVEEKVSDWLTAGTKLVWVVNPKLRTVALRRPGPQITVLHDQDQLQGEDVLPGFACRVAELFA
jgi:Uma2 family endonuclease